MLPESWVGSEEKETSVLAFILQMRERTVHQAGEEQDGEGSLWTTKLVQQGNCSSSNSGEQVAGKMAGPIYCAEEVESNNR